MPNYLMEVEMEQRLYKTLSYVLEAENEDEAREAMEAWLDDDPAGAAMEADTVDSEMDVDHIVVTEVPHLRAQATAKDWL